MKEKRHICKSTIATLAVVIMLLAVAPFSELFGAQVPKLMQMFAEKASAYDIEEYLFYTVSNNEATITDCGSFEIGSLTIPSTCDGYPVTGIGDCAFYNCTNLKSVTIPDSVTSIGDYAFYNCTGLKSVTIPESVISIGNGAFYNTAWYNALPDGDVYAGKVYYSYKGTMPENTNIIIKRGTVSIAGCAFNNCTGLTDVTIPDSVISIGENAFDDTAWYNALPDGDVYAGKVYYNYKGIMPENTSIVIKDGTKGIANHAFFNCIGLTSVTIPDSVINIDRAAFEKCAGLISVTIPDSVTKIGESAFLECTGLTSVTIPNSVTSIGHSAFLNCSDLTNITIPDSVTSIGERAFSGCSGLTSVTIPNGVPRIEGYTFYDCSGLTSITIPDSVKFIGVCSFSCCSGLTSITIPDSVKSIGRAAFTHCTSLKNVTIPDSVKLIEDYAFSGCDSLKEVYFTGNKDQWRAIEFGYIDAEFRDAEIHYNYSDCPHENYTAHKAKSETCTEEGYTAGVQCDDCGTWLSGHVVFNAHHNYKTTTTKATTSKDGKIVTACTGCGKVSETTPIYKASSIKLSSTKYTYNGKVKTPTVIVKNSKGKTLNEDTDYTVKYASGRKNTGKYSVKVTFKGNYTGTKTLYFNILPGKTSKLSATQTTTSIKATWKAVTGASGYKVTLYNSKGKAVKTVDTTKTTYTFSKLSKGTTYKVRVTAYKTIDKKKVDASVYTQLTTATKPGAPTLKVTAGTKKAALSWNKQTGATGYVVYMATSKDGKYSKIATVKGNSKVSYTKTGLTAGKTYYFKVRAYETVGGKTIYGDYSSVKSVKIK